MTTLHPDLAPDWIRPAMGLDVAKTRRRMGVRASESTAPTKREAAVLVLLKGSAADDAEVLLTHRSPTMRSHSGQIAFPGGRRDPEDINVVDTALREAWEETGLQRGTVTPLEQWGQLRVRSSSAPVSPVLAYWHQPGEVYPASLEETDDVFTTPIAELAAPENRLQIAWGNWTGPAFTVNDYLVWGFTGGILSALLEHAGWERNWDNNSVVDLRDALAASKNNEKMG
ncbi:NTP pyrophosphohydrolase [Corynebacterium camporealensis]|uniref:NTP pyrophosphohydrolase n=1 Tax=Corynebacterium camporealensis TaxID=161896 RepID=A0A0F6TAE6_9CORY|nr:CoA pyrophosphatase [Corynebacterium camporealensis]AKE38174.1 NTP pyrophosphohydrolase [Corynebacterium camporealensis]AVH87491.1 NTP pyrophosphohydrolase [Corynebacterium camporealensis]MDY5839449.1 CoA pyrophosphatase [Corynebacterium camporealensis]